MKVDKPLKGLIQKTSNDSKKGSEPSSKTNVSKVVSTVSTVSTVSKISKVSKVLNSLSNLHLEVEDPKVKSNEINDSQNKDKNQTQEKVEQIIEKALKLITEDVVLTHLTNRYAIELLKNDVEMYDMPHIFLKGSSTVVKNVYTSLLAKKMTQPFRQHQPNQPYLSNSSQTRTQPLVPLDPEKPFIKGNAIMFKIDVCNGNIHESIKFIQGILRQRSLLGPRHVVAINIVDVLKHNPMLAIKSVLDESENVFFIVTGSSSCFIDQRILHVCTQIRMDFDIERFKFNLNNGTVGTVGTVVSSDPLDIILLYYSASPFESTSLEKFIHKNLANLSQLLKKDKTTVLVYGKALRDFCIRIGASCVPISTVCHHILSFMPSQSPFLLDLVAEMDNMCALASKHIFALEYFMDLIVKKLNHNL